MLAKGRPITQILALLVVLVSGGSVRAALPVGAQAPLFSLAGALAGDEFQFELEKALQLGPVVVYFYPKAFTAGCTVEAHAFAEATDEFADLGARVVGVSTDELATLKTFSVSDCRDKFAVLADPSGAVVKQYDAVLPHRDLADRISYVVEPGGKIIYVHHTMEPKSHIAESLNALRRWSEANP